MLALAGALQWGERLRLAAWEHPDGMGRWAPEREEGGLERGVGPGEWMVPFPLSSSAALRGSPTCHRLSSTWVFYQRVSP